MRCVSINNRSTNGLKSLLYPTLPEGATLSSLPPHIAFPNIMSSIDFSFLKRWTTISLLALTSEATKLHPTLCRTNCTTTPTMTMSSVVDSSRTSYWPQMTTM